MKTLIQNIGGTKAKFLLILVLAGLLTGLGLAKVTIGSSGVYKDGNRIDQGGLFDITKYVKLDGSNSMNANLSLGGNSLENIQYLTPFNSVITFLGGLDLNGNSIINAGGLSGECPSGYVWVPGSSKHGTQPGFCVMKWEAKDDGAGNPVSQASGSPWVNIDQYDARKECRSLGSGYHLITESEWMTIRENAMRQPANWDDGTVGSKASNGGGMYLGNVAPPSSHSHLGYDGSNPDSGTNNQEVRTFELSNGAVIWDLSGNVWEWTSGYMTSDEVPEPDANDRTEYTDITNFRGMGDERPPNPAFNSSNGIGQVYTDQTPYSNNEKRIDLVSAVRRGGNWGIGRDAGVFGVYLNYAPSRTASHLGFRCSLTPVS